MGDAQKSACRQITVRHKTKRGVEACCTSLFILISRVNASGMGEPHLCDLTTSQASMTPHPRLINAQLKTVGLPSIKESETVLHLCQDQRPTQTVQRCLLSGSENKLNELRRESANRRKYFNPVSEEAHVHAPRPPPPSLSPYLPVNCCMCRE